MRAIELDPRRKDGKATLLSFVWAFAFLGLLGFCAVDQGKVAEECAGNAKRTAATVIMRDDQLWDRCTGRRVFARNCYFNAARTKVLCRPEKEPDGS